VVIYPQALEALANASSIPYKFVIVTNQSPVGRGIISLEQAQEINTKLLNIIRQAGGRIDGIFMCPHAPQEKCACRKPMPDLLFQAAEKLSLDLSRSMLIGDALSDLLAGQAASLPTTILVRTGRGVSQDKLPKPDNLKPYLLYETLADALNDIRLGNIPAPLNTPPDSTSG
jgi:D-glycero-D-manno-heptose 1,7-bisphosphate phosphatase